MSREEYKLLDTQGRFLRAVRDGRRVEDAGWTSGRILLSNRRLVLAGTEGKRTLPLSKIERRRDRYDVNQAVAQVSGYVPLARGEDLFLVQPADLEPFEWALYRALLDHRTLLVKHPAVEGGVVTDAEWQRARLKIDADDRAVGLAVADGTFVEVDLDDIGSISTAERTVSGEKRSVVEVEHSEEGTSLQTYVSGNARHCSHLEGLLRKGEQKTKANLDLDDDAKQVLMALYSGVSPFGIADFVGIPVDEVEETYDELIELGVLEEVRIRREVSLTARGRNLASGAMNDE